MAEKETNLRRSKSCKQPELRLTNTTRLRILKANPLLKLNNDLNLKFLTPNLINSLNKDVIKKIKETTNSVESITSKESKKATVNKSSTSSLTSKIIAAKQANLEGTFYNNAEYRTATNISEKVGARGKVTKTLTTKLSSNKNVCQPKAVSNISSKIATTTNSTKNGMFIKPNCEQVSKATGAIPKKLENKKKGIRRSLSAQHFDRKKGKMQINPKECYREVLNKSQSLEDVSRITQDITPISTYDGAFKTPILQRKSLITSTPGFNIRKSSGSKPVIYSNLQNRLSDWLKRRGKSLNSYHHLRCFGVDKNEVVIEEDKENVEVIQMNSESYEDLQIGIAHCVEQNGEPDLSVIAKDALNDLHDLIIEGYPKDQCEVWLCLIRQKYTDVTQEPQYWECRAKIDSNFGSAVECYQEAVVRGAEVKQVSKCLDQLFEKFKLLNITPGKSDVHSKVVNDARNVFKSFIIQFAVEKRKSKNRAKGDENVNDMASNQKNVSITPVRRSTRCNRSGFTLTPGIRLCSSLQEIDNETKQNMIFHSNNAL